MNTNRESTKKALEDKGIKPTFPRLKIFEYLLAAMNHPTVEEIYRHLIKEIPTISKTTIYNTLQNFVESSLVVQLLSGSQARYDALVKPHHHFVCSDCGKVTDIDIVCPNLCRKEIEGHLIKEIHGYFLGTCSKCRAKGER
jgi:Fur family transcriptional regulator, peroxide stress response regulator